MSTTSMLGRPQDCAYCAALDEPTVDQHADTPDVTIVDDHAEQQDADALAVAGCGERV